MCYQLPMLENRLPIVVMKHSTIIPEVIVNYLVTVDISQAFVLNNCEIQVLSSTPEGGNCSSF